VNERARKEGAIGSSLETQVTVTVPSTHPSLAVISRFMSSSDASDVLSASQVTLKVVDGEDATRLGNSSPDVPSPLHWQHCCAGNGKGVDAGSIAVSVPFSYSATVGLKNGRENIR
jgi:hypothetical protein